MVVRNIYRGQNRSARFAFSDTDVLLGVAFQDLFGMAANTAGDYILTAGTQESDPIETSFSLAMTSAAYIERFNKDFDLTFETTQMLDGTLTASIPVGCVPVTSAATVKAKINVIHYDGSTETSIGTAESPAEDDEFSAGTDRSTVFAMSADLTRQLFKVGDVLRITVTIEVNSGGGAMTGTGYVAHDPAGRQSDHINESVVDTATGNGPTKMHFRVPIQIPI